MTELMKQYEEEAGKEAVDYLTEYPFDEYTRWLEAKAKCNYETVEAFQQIIRNQCDEISALKEQLTWHPASEKPEEGQFVFGYNQKTKYFDVIFFYNGGFYLRGIAVTITHWLPIPPVPEGERK